MNIDRLCTCHPSDNPPVPCARRYALGDCKAADYDRLRAEVEALQARIAEDDKLFVGLAYMMCAVGNISLYEDAMAIAADFGRDAPENKDYAAAMRAAIDLAIKLEART